MGGGEKKAVTRNLQPDQVIERVLLVTAIALPQIPRLSLLTFLKVQTSKAVVAEATSSAAKTEDQKQVRLTNVAA